MDNFCSKSCHLRTKNILWSPVHHHKRQTQDLLQQSCQPPLAAYHQMASERWFEWLEHAETPEERSWCFGGASHHLQARGVRRSMGTPRP